MNQFGNQGFGQLGQIHQRSMQAGMMAQPQINNYQSGFGGQMNQGFQNQVNQNQLDRIHQNSLFGGAEQSVGFGQERQIHQRSMQAGMMAQPQANSYQNGFGGNASNMMMGGFGAQQNVGGAQQNYGGQMNQGFQNQVSQNQLDRIHQNSLYGGNEQSMGFDQEQQIHQRSMQSGMMAQPQFSNSQGGFGGGASSMMASNFGGAQNFGAPQNFGAGQNFGGAQNFAAQQNFGGQMNQGFQNQVSQNQLDRIHQNSLFGGAEQGYGQMGQMNQMGGQIGQIHQRTMQAGMMAQPQANNYQSGFGGGASTMMGGQGAFRSIMNADQGMTDDAGPSQYSASMYAGRNQYDNLNQAVFSEMANMGGQFGGQFANQYGNQFGNQYSSR